MSENSEGGGLQGWGGQLQGEVLTWPCPLPPNQQVRLCSRKQRTSNLIPKVSNFPCPFGGQGRSLSLCLTLVRLTSA